MSTDTSIDVRRRAGWLPQTQDQLEAWIRGRTESRSDRQPGAPLHPAVEAFRTLIEGDAILRMHANQMIDQVPAGRDYQQRHLHSLEQMLTLIDELLHAAPEFSSDSMVMTPLAAILDWTTATPAGYAFYRDPRVNAALRDILNAWSDYLTSPASRSVLTDSDTGWLGQPARDAVGLEQYQHDPDAEYFGFASWNDFFTRRFRVGQRPTASPADDAVIVAPCEATPYRIASKIRRSDEFWAKSELYSLQDMLAGDDTVDQFVGGTVFQAFLSALNYHRWHAPVAGTIVRAHVVPGTYFSEADAQGAGAAEPTNSQGYMAHVATRAIIIIDADDPAIGLVAAVFIGMVDVSSCVIGDTITPGARIGKGDELGYFQYGGSTVCLVFGPGVIGSFALEALPQAPDEQPALLQVRSHLATARHPQSR